MRSNPSPEHRTMRIVNVAEHVLVILGTVGLYVLALIILLSLPGCVHEPPVAPLEVFGTGGSGGGGNNDVPCDPNVVWFQQQVLPVLVSSCGIPGCHDSETAEEDIVLTSYSVIMGSDVLDPGDPWDSDMVEAITDSDPDNVMPPSPHEPLTAAQIDLIVNWIQQGAQNNSCESGCDTTNVTWSGSIIPLLANKCVGCHSGTNASGGLNFTAWPVVNMVALDGRLAGAVQHQASYVSMPPSGGMLPQCEIDQLLIWIGEGAPNN